MVGDAIQTFADGVIFVDGYPDFFDDPGLHGVGF